MGDRVSGCPSRFLPLRPPVCSPTGHTDRGPAELVPSCWAPGSAGARGPREAAALAVGFLGTGSRCFKIRVETIALNFCNCHGV